jgi:methionyl aminopeptidase
MTTRVKSKAEISAMRESGRMLGSVLEWLKPQVVSGVTTKELAVAAAAELKSLGGKPAFLGYQGFPDVICISVNQEVVHGIPSVERVLAKGDVVGLDFGVNYKGMITDGAISVITDGTAEQKVKDLVKYTEAAMYAGIETLHDNVRAGDIGAAVQAVLDKHRLGIVRDLVGHGVGHELHEDPNIPNYGKPNTGPYLQAGMTIAIEPMATLGTDRVYVGEDGWTIMTYDDSIAAHFEHTVLITEDSYDILTKI